MRQTALQFKPKSSSNDENMHPLDGKAKRKRMTEDVKSPSKTAKAPAAGSSGGALHKQPPDGAVASDTTLGPWKPSKRVPVDSSDESDWEGVPFEAPKNAAKKGEAGADVLDKVDAVCSLDAAWDGDTGEAVAVIVVRQSGEDRVWLVRGKPGGAFVATKVTSKKSKGLNCGAGIVMARVALAPNKALVLMNDAAGNQLGDASYSVVTGSTASAPTILDLFSATTDAMPVGTPSSALAWRGMASAVWYGDRAAIVYEAQTSDGKRVIALQNVKP